MKSIFLINPLEDLTLYKDSSLFWALTLQQSSREVYLFFPQDFSYEKEGTLKVYPFTGKIAADFTLKHLELLPAQEISLREGDEIYMRHDPPYDEHYQHLLWYLSLYENQGVTIRNRTSAIMKYQEKLLPLQYPEYGVRSYVGQSIAGLKIFLGQLREEKVAAIIAKPLNLYIGKGVRKIQLDDEKELEQLMSELPHKHLLVQPFLQEVQEKGELRTLFYRGREVATIRKVPQEGSFLANIAQGARFFRDELNPLQKERCQHIAADVLAEGADFVAFDLIGEQINEVNITCPALIVECSQAYGENIALKMLS